MGTLFYIVGPSGAGKDTLMNHARQCLSPAAPVLFAHRYITRPATAGGENHVALTSPEFTRMRELGLFALDWESHGLAYGIGCEIDRWLAQGADVVVNGSRGYLAEASSRYPSLRVVLLTVSPAVLRARLEARGRESSAEINARLRRASEFVIEHPNLVTLRNDGTVLESGDAFMRVLRETQPAAESRLHAHASPA